MRIMRKKIKYLFRKILETQSLKQEEKKDGQRCRVAHKTTTHSKA